MKNKSKLSFKEDMARRVLIVDDDEDFVMILAHTLRSNGYIPEVACSEKEGWKKIQDFDAQVVLIDIRLGSSDGINFLARIKKMHPKVLCLMMTAYATVDTSIKALQKGAYDYLRKPLDTNELLPALDRCFEKLHMGEAMAAAEASLKESNEELKRKHRIKNVLIEIMNISQMPYSLSEMLEHILEQIVTVPWLTFQSKGAIFIVEDQTDELVLKSYRELPKVLRKQCGIVPFGKCLCGRAASTQKIQFANSTGDNHEIRYKDISPHGHYCVPILSSGKTLGVLVVTGDLKML